MEELNEDFGIPFFENTAVPAGFPSPANDYACTRLNLNDHLIRNKTASFLVKVVGNSMINCGIYEDDILVIDRSEEPKEGKIVVAAINGEFTVKRLKFRSGLPVLIPENPAFKAIYINPEDDFLVWGIVKHVIHKV